MKTSRSIAISMAGFLAMAVFAGCEQDRVSNIPASATLYTSGNAQLAYTAVADGQVWVYDVNNDRIDYSGPIGANQSITVDPDSRKVTLDGRIVSDKSMSSGAQHRIYFLPNTR
jgi:hypothetical protein